MKRRTNIEDPKDEPPASSKETPSMNLNRKIKIKDIFISEVPWKLDGIYGTFGYYTKQEAKKIKKGLLKIIKRINKKLKA